jgi:hypothetical protein
VAAWADVALPYDCSLGLERLHVLQFKCAVDCWPTQTVRSSGNRGAEDDRLANRTCRTVSSKMIYGLHMTAGDLEGIIDVLRLYMVGRLKNRQEIMLLKYLMFKPVLTSLS